MLVFLVLSGALATEFFVTICYTLFVLFVLWLWYDGLAVNFDRVSLGDGDGGCYER